MIVIRLSAMQHVPALDRSLYGRGLVRRVVTVLRDAALGCEAIMQTVASRVLRRALEDGFLTALRRGTYMREVEERLTTAE